jgi:hypothetical protein
MCSPVVRAGATESEIVDDVWVPVGSARFFKPASVSLAVAPVAIPASLVFSAARGAFFVEPSVEARFGR